MRDLISFVREHDTLKREDLAGEVLASLMRTEAGQKGIAQLLTEHNEPHAAAPIEIETRKQGIGGCIPDIHLIQGDLTIALLELKFWAGLTAAQSTGQYFKTSEHVFFVCPDSRVNDLEATLSKLPKSPKVLSWKQLLEHITVAEDSQSRHQEHLFNSSLEHLKEFCDAVEKETFMPLTPEELHKPEIGVQTRHLIWLTRESLLLAAKEKIIDGTGIPRAGHDELFYFGQQVTMRGYPVWIGFWPYAWERSPSLGPIWAQFSGKHLNLLRSHITGLRTDVYNDLTVPLFAPNAKLALSQEEEVLIVVSS